MTQPAYPTHIYLYIYMYNIRSSMNITSLCGLLMGGRPHAD